MIRKPFVAVTAVLALFLGGLAVANPVGAVVDSATIVSAPSPGTSFTSSRAISCVTASSCVATGGYFSQAAGKVQTLVLQWDGVSWTHVPSLSPGSNDNYLFSVSCVSSSSCVAFGSFYDGGGVQRTLMLSLTGPEPTPTTTTTAASDPVTPAFTG